MTALKEKEKAEEAQSLCCKIVFILVFLKLNTHKRQWFHKWFQFSAAVGQVFGADKDTDIWEFKKTPDIVI